MVVNFSEAMTFSSSVVSAFTLFRHGTGGTTGNVTLSGPRSDLLDRVDWAHAYLGE